MPWSQIIEQQAAVHHLQETLASQRVGHAYLFHGPVGVGKRAAAQALAQALQCRDDANPPCGMCAACRRIDRLTHPDVHVLAPLPSDATAEDVESFRKNLAENPYAASTAAMRGKGRGVRRSAFSVDRVHSEIHQVEALHAVEGPYKVFILLRAEAMAPQAANAFLKVLEEPTPMTVFVLTTSRIDLLLPTIVSRCQTVAFTALSRESIEKGLLERDGMDPSSAATYAALSGGSYARALELSNNPDLKQEREDVIEFLRQSYMQTPSKLAPLIDHMARLGRDRLEDVLLLMLSWIRDLVHYRAMGTDAALENIDYQSSVQRFTQNMPSADLDAMATIVEKAITLTSQNVHASLLLTVLSQRLGQAMRNQHSGQLAPPLTEL